MALTVLVLCTGNSARSIMGEALFNHLGDGRVEAHSAGSQPSGVPHPQALARLRVAGIETEGYASKSWNDFAAADAPEIDVAITVCDNAAAETCPFFPGAPIRVHWGLSDPAVAQEDTQPEAFDTAFRALRRRVKAALALPFETMAPNDLRRALQAIGDATP